MVGGKLDGVLWSDRGSVFFFVWRLGEILVSLSDSDAVTPAGAGGPS
jgi:hypothetical protein